MILPTQTDIELLHRKYAPSDVAFNEIWQHCLIVKEIALWCIDNSSLQVNTEEVVAGCLLHDIGVYKLYGQNGELDGKNYVTHGYLGYELLKREGLDEGLCRFAARHTGVGISAEDVQEDRLPMPIMDYFAETEEERLAMYADKFHSKYPSVFNSAEWYAKFLRGKHGDAKARRFESMLLRYGEPPIGDMAKARGLPVNKVS